MDSRAQQFNNNVAEGMTNKEDSSIHDILKVAILYGL